MPLKQIETSLFVMINYSRNLDKDFSEFRNEINKLCADRNFSKDVVLNFSSCVSILTAEITLILTLLKMVEKNGRKLRLIPGADLLRKMEILRIDKHASLVVYKDNKAFLSEYVGDRIINN